MLELLHDLGQPGFAWLRYAVLVGVLSGVPFGVLGSFVVARRISYLAGAVAHTALGGIGLGLYVQSALGWQWCPPIYVGAAAGVGGALLIGWLGLRGGPREDTLISAVWAVGMAVGLLCLARTPGYVDPMSYLFGDILVVGPRDLVHVIVLGLASLALAGFAYARLLAVCFDDELTRVRGVRAGRDYLVLLCLTALSIVLLVRVVGIVLVIALLTLPAAVAGQFARRLWQMMALAVVLCMAFTLTGLGWSYQTDLPSGPMIILTAGLVYLAVGMGRWALRRARG